MNNPEFDRIQAASQEQPNNCSCNVCANMCKRNPCLGTPSDILRLINNGYVQENVERHLTVLVARTWEDTSNDKTVTLIVKALKKVIEHDERTT